MKKYSFYKLLLVALSFATTGFAQITTLTLQPGSSGIDAHVYSNAATTNYSTSVTLQAGRDGSGFRTRGLLAYDLSAIPSNAIVSSAVLTLYGTAHTGTNPAYLRKNTSAWLENTVTWNTLPSATAIGQISFAQSTSGTQTYTADVKSFVQEMVNIPATNYGWTLIKQNENVAGELVFGSSDNSNAALRPKLEIAYSLPMEVKTSMTPATGSLTADGALNISVTNGIPPFTYLWSDASTGKDLYNKAPGVYSFTVTDNGGNKVKKELLIAAENTALTFTITPDALSGMDGLIQRRDDGTLVNNVNKNYPQFKADRGTSSGWFSSRSLMAFDLSFLPAAAAVSSASLMLYGNGHNPLNRPNDAYLYLNTAPWYESSLTWNTQPAHTTTGSIYLAATSSSTQNASLDITSQVQGWVQNPSTNYGWKLMLADEATSSYTSRIYGASANATVALRPQLVITVSVPQLTDTYRNWEMEESYDENGTVIASQKTYMDDLGRVTQSLSKDANGDVFASQTVYDAYGRPALTSLPAYSGSSLYYNTRLLLNTSAAEYNYTNFDVAGKVSNPDPVQTGLANTVGTYYSNSNTLDTWQATATFPYNRTHYLAEPISDVKTVNSAEDAFNVTSGREARNYGMVCGDELKFILGNNNSYKVEMDPSDPLTTTALTVTAANYVKATKSITTSPDNKEVVSYSVGNQVIATCMSGLSSPDNCTMIDIRNYMNWYGTQDIDIHVPDANKSSISFPLPTYKIFTTTYTVSSADIAYTLTDLNSETPLVSLVDYTINAGTRALTFSPAYLTANSGKPLFLRIGAAYTNTFVNSLTNFSSVPSGIVEYDLDYGRWSVNYYDVSGDLRKSVSAKGINCAAAGSVSMATVYDYSHLGQVIAKQSPDEGLVEYAYNTDGQLRFSQNAEQKLGKRFSYTSYDSQNRPVESGEFTNLFGSGSSGIYFQNYYSDYAGPYHGNVSSATIIDYTDGLDDNFCNDVYHSSYEELSAPDDIPSAYTYTASYLGKYKNGQLSKTWNENTSTWYKYDEAGRLFATVKQVNDLDYTSYAGLGDAQIKTFESSYDPYFGSVTNTWYQKHVSAEYAQHGFTYDANKRLSAVNFTAGIGGGGESVCALGYDKLGRLSRQELGPNLQGVDYVYTLGGRLKAINHPSLDYTRDRGGDNDAYYDAALHNTGTKLDLFGEILEYYPGDYSRSGTSIEANTNGLYNGLIYGARYKTRNTVHAANTGADYININGGADEVRLISATNYEQQELANRYTYDAFGQLAISSFGTYTNTTNSFTARNEYKEFGVTNNSIGYDANGNITRLKRNAYVVGGSQQLLDDLTYTISASGNNHTKVADAASNSFPMSFNFKNPGGSAQSFSYNAMGQLTASPDESVTAVSYYPNGQVKQVNFANGNTTNHYYDDQGQRYKSVFYNATTTNYKYNWYLFGVMYEYLSNLASFDLKELPIGGMGRVGVYKQDATGLSIGTGHTEYELTDHLGNVRVTFKQGTNTNLEVLSKADYYAFGGQLPGRIWQQSGGEYRYGYQGQEKSMDETNWDNFELRNFNHDLGRWSAPDPYAQFHSPYIAMANNPINMTDPDGGRTTLPGWTVGASTHDKFISPSMAWFCAPGPIGFYAADLGDAIRFGVDGPDVGGDGGAGGGSIMETIMEKYEKWVDSWDDEIFDYKDKRDGTLLSTYTRDGGNNTYGNNTQGLEVYERERWSKLAPLERSAFAGLGEDVLAAAYLTQFISATAYNIQEGNNDFKYGDWFGKSLWGNLSFNNVGPVTIGNETIKIDKIEANATENTLIPVQFEDHTMLTITGPRLANGKTDRNSQETIINSKTYMLSFTSLPGGLEPGKITLSVIDRSMAGSKFHDANGNERIFNNPPVGLNSIIGIFNQAYDYYNKYNRMTLFNGQLFMGNFNYDFRRQWPY